MKAEAEKTRETLLQSPRVEGAASVVLRGVTLVHLDAFLIMTCSHWNGLALCGDVRLGAQEQCQRRRDEVGLVLGSPRVPVPSGSIP